jgi:ketosteroid isomerase-like protein
MRRTSLVVSTLLLSAAACQPPAPAGLTDKDKATIDSLDQKFTGLAIKGDFDGLVSAYYSDDAVLLPPNAPPATGHAAIVAFFRTFPPITAFQLHTAEIEGAGDLAYLRGHYVMTMTPPGGPAMADSGKYLEIWRKQSDGSWKAARDMFSSDVPLPMPPAPDTTAKKPAGKKKG